MPTYVAPPNNYVAPVTAPVSYTADGAGGMYSNTGLPYNQAQALANYQQLLGKNLMTSAGTANTLNTPRSIAPYTSALSMAAMIAGPKTLATGAKSLYNMMAGGSSEPTLDVTPLTEEEVKAGSPTDDDIQDELDQIPEPDLTQTPAEAQLGTDTSPAASLAADTTPNAYAGLDASAGEMGATGAETGALADGAMSEGAIDGTNLAMATEADAAASAAADAAASDGAGALLADAADALAMA